MVRSFIAGASSALLALGAFAGCSEQGSPTTGTAAGGRNNSTVTDPFEGPAAGYVDGQAAVPPEAQAEDVSAPTSVVGDGSSASCTSEAFVTAVAKGGIITFSCGPDPVTIVLTQTAKVFNDKGSKLVIDGGNKV